MKYTIEKIQSECRKLVFDAFTYDDAWELGLILAEKARASKYPVSLSVTIGHHRVFYCSLPGSAPTNDRFIHRKENLVYESAKSSLEMQLQEEENKEYFYKFWGLNPEKYVLAGGSVPVVVEGMGVVGTATCSGLASEEDHAFVVEAMNVFKKKRKMNSKTFC